MAYYASLPLNSFKVESEQFPFNVIATLYDALLVRKAKQTIPKGIKVRKTIAGKLGAG